MTRNSRHFDKRFLSLFGILPTIFWVMFSLLVSEAVFGQYSSPFVPTVPVDSFNSSPFYSEWSVNSDPTLNTAQPGYATVQQITPTQGYPQGYVQPQMVPLEQNYQYIDSSIGSLNPQEYASLQEDTWRLASTQTPAPSSIDTPMSAIDPEEIKRSQEAMGSMTQGSDFDPQFIGGSQNFQEQPVSFNPDTMFQQSNSGYSTSNGTSVTSQGLTTTPFGGDPFFSQSADNNGLVALDPNRPDDPEEIVTEVVIEGNGGVPHNAIRDKIKTLAGRPFKAQMVEEDARTLYNTGNFSKVSPYIRKTDDGVTVVFRLVEHPLLNFVKIIGNKRYTKEELKEETGLKPGDPMDVSAVLQAKDKIEAKYKMDGSNRVHIDIMEGDRPSDRGAVFVINEGVRQRILSTDFSGNRDIPSGRLKTRIESKKGILYYIGGEFTREKLDSDVQTLKDYYRNLGYFNAEIDREYEEGSGYFGIDQKGSWIEVHFIVSEGIRSKIRNVKFIGNKVYSSEELTKAMKIKPGYFFDRGAVESDKIKIKELYGEKGYAYAVVKEDIRYLEQPGMLDLVYMIRELMPAVAATVDVEFQSEQSHTKLTSILDRVDIRPGQLITRNRIEESKRMLRYDKFLNTDPSQGAVPMVQVVPSDPEMQKLVDEAQNFDGFEDEENHEHEEEPNLFRGQNPEKQTSLNWVAPVSSGNIVNAGYQTSTNWPPVVVSANYQTENQGTSYQQVQQVQYTYPQETTSTPLYNQYVPAPSTLQNQGGSYSTPQSSTIPSFPYSVQTTVISDNSTSFMPSTSIPQNPPPVAPNLYGDQASNDLYGLDHAPVVSPSSVTQGGYFGENSNYGSITQVGVQDPWNDSTLNRPILGSGVGRFPINGPPIPDYIPSDVKLLVDEGRTGSIMASVMVNSDAGLMGRFAIQENNFDWKRVPTNPFRFESWRKAFRGGGQQFLLEAMPGTTVQSYNVTWKDPKFLHTRYSLGLNGSYYTRYYDEWRERRVGGGVSLGRAWTNRFSTTISANASDVYLYDPIETLWGVPPDITESLGHNSLYGFGLSAAYDYRDSPMMATEGGLISGGVEQVLGTTNFVRGNLDLRRYFMLRERLDRSGRWVLGLRSAAGLTSGNTPIYERYYGGGTSSIRGFEYRGVSPRWAYVPIGGNFEFYNSAELCFPLTYDDNIRGVFFLDTGTVEEDIKDWKYDYRVAVGFGLRLCIPAMGPVPIAFDFAFPITKDSSDETQVFSFTMSFMR